MWALAVAAVFALIQLPSAPGRFYPDSAQYLARTYDLLGKPPAVGRELTVQAFCDAYRRPRLVDGDSGAQAAARAAEADRCVRALRLQNDLAPDNRYGPAITRGPPIVSHRYEEIFLSRPAVAVLYAPGVAVFGARPGMWLTTLLWTLVGSLLIFVLLRVIGCSPGAALLGQVLYLVLPVRYWTTAPLAEGMTLTLLVLCLLGVAYLMTGRTRLGLVLMSAGFGLGLFVKYSQFLLFALALAGTATIALVLARRSGRPVHGLPLVVAGSVLAAVLHVAVAKLLGWPGGTETMQDLATRHFREPDVPDPVARWLVANAYFWASWTADQFRAPLMLVTWAVSAWGVRRSRTVMNFAVFAVLLAGLGNQVGHPNTSQADRLYLAAWLLTVCGLPLLLDHLRRHPTTATTVEDRHPTAADDRHRTTDDGGHAERDVVAAKTSAVPGMMPRQPVHHRSVRPT